MNRTAFKIASSAAIVAMTVAGVTSPSAATRRLEPVRAESRTDRQAAQYYDQASRALQQGDVGQAVTLMEQAVALSPRDPATGPARRSYLKIVVSIRPAPLIPTWSSSSANCAPASPSVILSGAVPPRRSGHPRQYRVLAGRDVSLAYALPYSQSGRALLDRRRAPPMRRRARARTSRRYAFAGIAPGRAIPRRISLPPTSTRAWLLPCLARPMRRRPIGRQPPPAPGADAGLPASALAPSVNAPCPAAVAPARAAESRAHFEPPVRGSRAEARAARSGPPHRRFLCRAEPIIDAIAEASRPSGPGRADAARTASPAPARAFPTPALRRVALRQPSFERDGPSGRAGPDVFEAPARALAAVRRVARPAPRRSAPRRLYPRAASAPCPEIIDLQRRSPQCPDRRQTRFPSNPVRAGLVALSHRHGLSGRPRTTTFSQMAAR